MMREKGHEKKQVKTESSHSLEGDQGADRRIIIDVRNRKSSSERLDKRNAFPSEIKKSKILCLQLVWTKELLKDIMDHAWLEDRTGSKNKKE